MSLCQRYEHVAVKRITEFVFFLLEKLYAVAVHVDSRVATLSMNTTVPVSEYRKATDQARHW